MPKEVLVALKERIRLQKEKVLIIKPCDKGAGLIILDFKLYMLACYDHLLLKQTNKNGKDLQYYSKVEDWEIEKSIGLIKSVLKEALKNEIITKSEFIEMDPSDKKPIKVLSDFQSS